MIIRIKSDDQFKMTINQWFAPLIKPIRNIMSKIGIVSGSFDPMTLGHMYVIERALTVVDRVCVLVANNPEKKYFFDASERTNIATKAIGDALPLSNGRVDVLVLPPNEFTASYASSIGASTIFRGIRNSVDYEYERTQDLFNSKIAPNVTTIYVMPPEELTMVSSSMVKSVIGMHNWQNVVANYIPKHVLDQLIMKAGKR